MAGCPLEEKISSAPPAACRRLAPRCACRDLRRQSAGGRDRAPNLQRLHEVVHLPEDRPIDIPQAETRILKDVLALPWGFEIYFAADALESPESAAAGSPRPRRASALVVGMGPAGFTLSHFLLNDGHTVIGVDGLKIEPLEAPLSGTTPNGERIPFVPIREFSTLVEPLDDRVMAGFGGVAEYGITVRWDKNFLKVIRLLLERRDRFALYGGVRFGGTLDVEGAYALGFDHVAIAAGAGRPTVLDLPNGLAHGVRTASDFLMGLQLTGAAKRDSITNLQVRLPVVVIGGGLTAIDATESLAYYPVQVEKFLTVTRHYRRATARPRSKPHGRNRSG